MLRYQKETRTNTRKAYIVHLNELGLTMDDNAFVMQRKLHNREIGYGELLRRYKKDEFEKLYDEWFKTAK